MSKPITFTDSMKKEMLSEMLKDILEKFNTEKMSADAAESVRKCNMSDGSFSFKKEFKYEKKFEYKNDKRRFMISITPDAYAKMLTIIMTNQDEVGWHGTTEKIADNEVLIKDIYVYPQEVTAATVDTDDEEYAKWTMDLDKIDENIFPNLHFHGHSHVNMGVSPSSTDMGHREKIVSQLGDHDYYVFMIWNKKLEWSASVYDMESNTLFESKDIDVKIEFADGTTAGDVVADTTKKVVKKSYVSKVYTPTPFTPNKTEEKEKSKKEKPYWEEKKESGKKKGDTGVGDGSYDFLGRQYYGGYFGGGYGYGCDWD